MTIEIRVPRLAESISDAVLAEWLKPDGATVRMDEAIATLETDKAAVEIAAQAAGVLHHAREVNARLEVGDLIARIEPAATEAPELAPRAGAVAAATPAARATPLAAQPGIGLREPIGTEAAPLSPAVRRMLEEHRLDPAEVAASGKGGRLLKEDVLRHLEQRIATVPPAPAAPMAPVHAPTVGEIGAPPPSNAAPAEAPPPATIALAGSGAEAEERVVPMNRIRQRIAERLVHAQQTAAILTTFNEVDMTAVQDLRARYREGFERKHGVRLGLLSFFVRACVLGLEEVPEINAEIRGSDIVYKRHVHLGLAVSTERGLVVPVVRAAETLGFAAIEREIARLSDRARQGQLSPQELSGGTFTLSNGGVFGSLLSTPILNPPQSGILGLHKIQKRPVAIDDQVVVRPMMYLALSYDHRIVDGQQAVTFLVRVKERLEDPERMLLDV